MLWYIWPIFPEHMHENEQIWLQMRGVRRARPRLGPPI